MRQRTLLIVGAGAIAASLLLGVAALAGGILGRHGGDVGMDRAVQVAQNVAASSGKGLVADEVIEFSQNYYASIREKDSGVGAFEILIDRSTGRVIREPGPDMMWNTKYSAMGGGMMGRYSGYGSMNVSAQKAQDIAQTWLDANRSGSTAKSPDPFYGYYTVDFTTGGRLAGMLSVNGYSGRVWFHSWHGSFVQMRDLGA